MKTSHKMIDKVSDALNQLGHATLFIINEDLVKRITHKLDPSLKLRHKNKNPKSNGYKKAMEHSYQITRRDLLKVLWLRNGKSSRGLSKEYGYIYILSNPAWPEKIKIGVTIDVPSRLSTYQTSSPYRDYKIEKFSLVKAPYEVERRILSVTDSVGEWVDKSQLEVVRSIITESSAAW